MDRGDFNRGINGKSSDHNLSLCHEGDYNYWDNIIGTQLPGPMSTQNCVNNQYDDTGQKKVIGSTRNQYCPQFPAFHIQPQARLQLNYGQPYSAVNDFYQQFLPVSSNQMSESCVSNPLTSHLQELDNMNWSMNTSFTELLLEQNTTSNMQGSFSGGDSNMFEPMGAENQMFMITDRYTRECTPQVFDDITNNLQSRDQQHQSNSPIRHTDGYQENFCEDEDPEANNEHVEFVDTGLSDDEGAGMDDKSDDQNGLSEIEIDEENSAQFDVPDHIPEPTGNNVIQEEELQVEHQEAEKQLTQDDIEKFLEEESRMEARSCSQEAMSYHVPHIDKIFDTDEQAYAFYNEYASIVGFSVLKANNYKGKSEVPGTSTRQTYRCNRSGKVLSQEELEAKKRKKQQRQQERTGKTTPANSRKRRRNTIVITNCQAKMIVTLKNSKWVVTNVHLQHNHDLSPHEESKYLRSHLNMTEDEKLFIRTFNSVKLPTRKIYAILTYLRGGDPRKVPYSKKHVSNVRTAIRQENSDNDMMQVLYYFRKRQSEDPRFYYAFQVGPNRKVQSIFWSDAYSRKMYDLYGDCLSFDTTYKTNKYNLPITPFVGVTGHGQNCLFACAILHNETIDTFIWLFKTFLHCMGGKQPATIITDQCVSMRTAIPEAFPNSRHRNYFFHIKKKAEEKCGRSFSRIPNLHAEFTDVLRFCLTEAEFEQLWPEMIRKYNVSHIKYFADMWKYKANFVPVYFKKDFFPFIHSTARSEGTNAIFKDNICSTYSVISFLSEYQKISDNIEESEREQDSITRTTDPTYWVHSELEIQAARKYNRKIFYKFQKQIVFSTKLHVDEVEKHVKYEVFKSKMLAMKDFRTRRYVVFVDLAAQDFSCICCKFQKDGIVCAHILRVLVQLNMSELPDKYYIDRWMPKERKDIRHKQFYIPLELTETNRHLRYTVLSRRLTDMASEGAVTNDKYLYVLTESERVSQGLDAMTTAEELKEIQEKRQAREATSGRFINHPDGYGENLQNPDVAPSKGRPQTVGRQKTFMEQLFSKQTITCSHCGDTDHNYATCTKKHLDKSLFEKKNPKKKRGAPTGTKKAGNVSGSQPRRNTSKKTKQQSSNEANQSVL